MTIYKWYCKVAEPELNEEGIAENQGLVAAEGMHAAMDRILDFMCLNHEEQVFELRIEPWDTDILPMDPGMLYDLEEGHIW